jgi:hypothetical protein
MYGKLNCQKQLADYFKSKRLQADAYVWRALVRGGRLRKVSSASTTTLFKDVLDFKE